MRKSFFFSVIVLLFCMLILQGPDKVYGEELKAPDYDLMEHAGIDSDVESGAIPEAKDQVEPDTEADESYFIKAETDLFSYPYQTVEDQTLSDYLLSCTEEEIAVWLTSLTEEETKKLLARDTILNESLDYYGTECEQCGFIWGTHYERAYDFYAKLSKCSRKKADYTYASTTGYIEIAFEVPGKATELSKIKVSGIDTTKQTNQRQMNLSCSVINGKYGLALKQPSDGKWHTWSASSNLENVNADLSKCQKNGPSSINYFEFMPEVTFKKPIGYKLSNPVYTNYTTSLHTFYTTMTQKTYTYNGKEYSGIAYLENSLKGDENYDQEKEIYFRASAALGAHYGVGVKSGGTITRNPGNYERATFTLTPAAYTMSYDANGGLSSVASQSVSYGGTYSYPASPKAAEYVISYEAVGGTVNVTSEKVPRCFLGWSLTPSATTGLTGNFLANQTKNGAVVTNYAIWGQAQSPAILPLAAKSYTITYNANGGANSQNTATVAANFLGWGTLATGAQDAGKAGTQYLPSKNVTLYAHYENGTTTMPTANRIGYQLAGWYTAAEGGALVKQEGQLYQPEKDMVLFAQWTPVTYQILLDANGGTLSGETQIQAVYDQAVTLPVPERVGYQFLGWKSETATYTEKEVMNLAKEEGTMVTLKALWEAVDVPYVIHCFFQAYQDGDYVRNEEKDVTAYAKADSVITVPALDESGYETPAAKLVTIAPDGSTVVEFYYALVKSQGTKSDVSGETIKTILDKLNEIDSVTKLSMEDWDRITALIIAATGVNQEFAKELGVIIRDSKVLTEQEKIQLFQAFANGYLSDELRTKLLHAIENSAYSKEEKEALIKAISSLSNLTLEEQQKLKELIEKGSSVSYQINGVSFEIKKNQDGTLSIFLKGLNGKTKVEIPDSVTIAGKTYAVTEISQNAFKNNTSLEQVVLGNNISKIGESAFEGCINLKEILIGPNVKEIGAKAFLRCKKLSKVTIKEGLLVIGMKAFYQCESLSKIKLPKSLLKIKSYAFGKCKNLKTVTFAAEALLVSMQNGVFSECGSLTKIKIPAKVTSIPKKTFYKDKKLISVTGMKRVTKVGESAFESCSKLTHITLDTKLQTIEKRAFYQCKKLKKVTLKSLAITKVGKDAFKKCSAGIKFSIPAKRQAEYAALFKGKY